MKYFFCSYLILQFLLYTATAIGQDAKLNWARSWENGVTFTNDVVTDLDGNVYIIGMYSGTVDFDPSDGVDEHSSADSSDPFVIKLAANGDFLWAKTYGGMSFDNSHSIAVDYLGNIIIVGAFYGTADFDPSDEDYIVTPLGSADSYILKLDADGLFVYVKTFGGASNHDFTNSITLDDAGNIYIAGSSRSDTIDFDPGLDEYLDVLEDEYTTRVFIVKLDNDGNFIWVKTIPSDEGITSYSLVLDNDNNILIGGHFKSSAVDFDPGDDVEEFDSDGSFDIFVEKLSNEGDFIWVNTIGGSENDFCWSIATDEIGNVLVIGEFSSESIDLDPSPAEHLVENNGEEDVLIVKLSEIGDFLWGKAIGGNFNEAAPSLDCDLDGNVYITGTFESAIDFDPSDLVYDVTSIGAKDSYILKLSEDGNYNWVKTVSGENVDRGFSIHLDTENKIFATGILSGNADLDPGYDTLMVSEGSLYLQVFEPCVPSYGIETIEACNSYIWVNGVEYDSSTTSPTFIFKGEFGCDSLVNLNLTILESNEVTDSIFSCESYLWIDGIEYFEDNSTATYTLTNEVGCDSLVNLNLEIVSVDVTVISEGFTLMALEDEAIYQWLDCNDGHSEIVGETGVSFTPVDDGDYAVKITIDGCTDTSECIAIAGVAIDERSLLSQISIYPNPSNGFINIDLVEWQDASIRIYSMTGELVYIIEYLQSGLHTFELNLTHGVYLVEVKSSKDIGQLQLVVD